MIREVLIPTLKATAKFALLFTPPYLLGGWLGSLIAPDWMIWIGMAVGSAVYLLLLFTFDWVSDD